MSEIENDKFEEKGIIYAFGENVFNLMVINFLWIVFSIPIVTIGASTTAMNYTCIKLRRDEGEGIIRSFFHSLKQNINGCLIMGTGMIAVLLILLVGLIQALGSAGSGSVLGIVAAILLTLILFLWLLLFVYIFMVYARFDNTIGRTLVNAVYFMGKHRGATLKVFSKLLITLIIVPYALWTYFPYGFPLVIFFGAAFTSYLISKDFNDVIFKDYIPDED